MPYSAGKKSGGSKQVSVTLELVVPSKLTEALPPPRHPGLESRRSFVADFTYGEC